MCLHVNPVIRYGCLALGVADLYLRFPPLRADGSLYREKVWDHAAGSLVVEEAGGRVTDCEGMKLQFGDDDGDHKSCSSNSSGVRLLSGDVRGIIACRPEVHAKLVKSVKDARFDIDDHK